MILFRRNISNLVENSLRNLISNEWGYIKSGVHERSVCGRLGTLLESDVKSFGLHGYFADIEYNRMLDNDLKLIMDENGNPAKINADLIVHGRTALPEDDNLIAVEMKKSYRSVDDKTKDRKRLISLTTPASDDDWFYDEERRPKFVAGYHVNCYIEIDIDRPSVLAETYIDGMLEKSLTILL